ncbi:MAG TPA: serine/threonine-protein kinase [Kofleriaceae bacterium]
MIQVGQVLDKYELLERVGQGGMAIVYRGIDRSLKRTVAIKILHKHLSDYQEARDRFEREAQAVAKLRHENILEIFDYSAKEGSESYIVTEFIDGQTLKQFFTERPITFPEVGAMIMLQVARALAHAHAVGILHRDVKPENIMIRSDGVVKLMDFGISHMVDLERLTVTGQLLGSPAYMAPEHVEGRQLDFRTDVFAVGIVLYQLTVGKLPFEGKNPHEVLKRIAECKFVDPRQANPRIGNRLGKIILRAMAAQPVDRYAAISEMVIALEAYLEESGLPGDKVTSELARYFTAPVSYEQALKERLVDHLSRHGQKLLSAGDQAPALDVFDRVLTIDPDNAKVLAILDGLNRRARLKHAAIAVLAAGVISFGGYMIHKRSLPPPPDEPPLPSTVLSPFFGPSTNVVGVEPAPIEQPDDAAVVVFAPATDARPGVGSNAPVLDAATQVVPPVEVVVTVSIASGSEWRLPGGDWRPVEGNTFKVPVEQTANVEVRNDCCETVRVVLTRDKPKASASLQFRPAQVKPLCAGNDVVVSMEWSTTGKVETRTPTIGSTVLIPFETDATSSTKTVTVTFTNGAKSDPHSVTVNAGKMSEVKCKLE